MWNIFTKKNNNEEIKQAILRELFNASKQEKAIVKAARESARDQKALVKKYHELKLNKECS